jgi:hypothetical protein
VSLIALGQARCGSDIVVLGCQAALAFGAAGVAVFLWSGEVDAFAAEDRRPPGIVAVRLKCDVRGSVAVGEEAAHGSTPVAWRTLTTTKTAAARRQSQRMVLG